MKNMAMDNFEYMYQEEMEFINDLNGLMAAQKWVEKPIRSMSVKNIPNVPMLIGTDDLVLDKVTVTDQYAIAETMQGIGLILDTPDESFLMRRCAYDTLLQRAAISGRSIHRLFDEQRHVFIEFVNKCMELYGEKSQILLREGRVAAILSRDYAILNQETLFNGSIKKIKERFGHYTFAEGLISEEYTSMLINLEPDPDLYVSLEPMLKKMGANQIFPSLRITTSDLGKSHARLTTLLKTEKGQMLGLGKSLELKHIGRKTSEGDFLQMVEVIYPLFNEIAERIMELEGETYYYPANVMAELCKKYKVPINLTNLSIERMKQFEGTGSMLGDNLYYYLCDILDVAKQEKMKGNELLFLEDSIGKMTLDRNWKRYDYPQK